MKKVGYGSHASDPFNGLCRPMIPGL